ncbi:type III restriction protein [Mycobacterium phage Bane1]|uniref:Type III restriction protein n=5 Tax=Coopervirus TaxID=1982898 RepID=T2A9A0_9CAUD|nr:DNA helicase [Mycobacterium phage Bane1]YP_010089235.1 DNA helicase [Mycobacterium phage Fortunato]AGU92163.1 type III restriction protein [Mycobacterium phage Bane2]QBI96116.1 DNA helicase [Mycobacterium phage Waleliano]QFG08982.1 DNA helicase [Mycobacterium phage Magpie]QJD51352.1 DNA helicase [Mycobacterium phage RawrgerThat]AGU92063.1 type III restriction protein [Mycobacterium phage Bane1]
MTTTAAPAPRQLRDYQVAAVDAVERDWASGKNRVGVVLPTGSGKSSVIGETGRRALDRSQRVLCLAHRGELLDQMRRDFIAVAPHYADRTGIVRAETDDSHADIVFATLQTLATAHRRQALGKRHVILWDEVHHAGAEGFHTTFSELGGYDDALMAGFTATMYRNERGVIGLGDVIQKISYEKDIRWAIKKGFLVQPRGLTVRIKGLDALNDVRSVAGDFHQGELAEVMEACTQYVVDAIKLHAADRRPIIFAASVDAAHHIADALSTADFPAVAVTGAMKYEDRLPIYESFRDGTARALVTVQVLTEGADFPMCDTVVLARPTRSRNLYSQMVGRALRLYPNKDDALVLDLAGSTRAMKLVSLTALDTGAETREVDEFGEDIELDEDDLLGDGGGEPAVKEVRQGPVDMVSIDLLANSDLVWMETVGGIPFLPLMEDNQVVFIMPEGYRVPPKGQADTVRWAIGQMGTRSRRGGWVTASGRFPIHTDDPDFTDLATALENAEVWIVESDQQLPVRKASWRRNQKPSEAQLKFARTLGIVIDDDMTKARLSDEISVRVTSRVLDKFLEA